MNTETQKQAEILKKMAKADITLYELGYMICPDMLDMISIAQKHNLNMRQFAEAAYLTMINERKEKTENLDDEVSDNFEKEIKYVASKA